MTVYNFKKKPEVVAGVQWSGYNLYEVMHFLGRNIMFPGTKDQYSWYDSEQATFRNEGYPVNEILKKNKAYVNDWIVLLDDDTYSVRTYDEVRENYILDRRVDEWKILLSRQNGKPSRSRELLHVANYLNNARFGKLKVAEVNNENFREPRNV